MHAQVLWAGEGVAAAVGILSREVREDSGREVHQTGELLKMPLTAEQKLKVHKPEFGLPSLSIFNIGARSATNPNPTSGHQWFSPIIPRSGEAVFEANRIFSKAGREHGLPVPPYSIPFTFWERSFLFLFGFR